MFFCIGGNAAFCCFRVGKTADFLIQNFSFWHNFCLFQGSECRSSGGHAGVGGGSFFKVGVVDFLFKRKLLESMLLDFFL